MRKVRPAKRVFHSCHGEIGGIPGGNALFLVIRFHYSRSLLRIL